MNKALLWLSLLLAVCLAGQTVAPGSSNVPPGSSRSRRGAAPGGERSMKGCLIKDESGAYMLQAQHDAKVKLESPEDLGLRVGHQVRVTGAFVDHPSGPNGAASATSNANSNSPLHSVRAFRVFKLEVLSPTCSSRKK